MPEHNAIAEAKQENTNFGEGFQEVQKDLFPEELRSAPGQEPRNEAKVNISEELLNKGIMPALDRADIPSTLADAAKALAGKDLGLPSDQNRSSGTAVSRLLQAVGVDIKTTPYIPDLKEKLEQKGWKSLDLQDKSSLKPGDLVFTSMNPTGRNVGIVGENGTIFSHSYPQNKFVGSQNWSSKFVTVMRQGDK